MDKFFTIDITDGSSQRRLHLSDPTQGYGLDLGIETGTLESFFSFENRALGTATEQSDRFYSDGANWAFDAEIAFETASVMLRETGAATAMGGYRNLQLRARGGSSLMDCVQRFVVPKSQVKTARIGAKIIAHTRRNFYHQFPAEEVTLTLQSGVVLRFTPDLIPLPKGFAHMVYLRDEPEAWILHFRALALAPDRYVLKGCSRWFNRPVPQAVQNVVFAIPGLRDGLLYIRERLSQRIPFQVNGAVDMMLDDVLELSVRWRVEDA